ncbi:ATP-binding protein [Nibricoccus aquaticus]|nr:ATP-binding protein [Nibricoccus aquaticus]
MILSCAVLITVSWLAVRTIHALRDANDRVVHTQEVLVRLERLKFDLKGAESAARGFVLEPKPVFIDEIAESRMGIERGLDELSMLVSDNRRQVDGLVTLRPLIARRLGLIQEVVALRSGGTLTDAVRERLLGDGLETMALVMDVIEGLAQQEKLLLGMRVKRSEGRLNWVYAAIGGGFFLSLILTGWPILRLRGELREREKARRQLVASSERIQDLYNQAPCGYFSVSGGGQITAMNDTLLRWMGLERAGLTRLTLEALCAPEMRADIAKWLRGSDTSAAFHERELEFVARDGKKRPVWLTAAQSTGGVDEWRITAVDIAERKRAEAVVAHARDQAESIVNTVRQPLIVLTEDLRVASANRAFHTLFNTDESLVAGRRFAEICDRQWNVPELLRALEDVVPKQKAVEGFEVSVNLPKKGRRLFEINASKLYRAGNHTTMTLVAIEDVTARKDLDDVHRQFRALFESLPGRYLVLSPEFTVVAVSDAYLAMTMTKRAEILGRNMFEIFPENADAPTTTAGSSVRASLNRVLQTGSADTMAVLRYDILRPDGSFEERHWSPVNSPVFGADKKVEYLIHRAEDVTEFVLAKKLQGDEPQAGGQDTRRERLETEMLSHSRELGSANEQLRALNEELEAFSYSVSHDLRAPLRHVAGFSEMLAAHAAESLDDKGRRYLKTITDSAARMGTLIDDLLMFSRMGRTEMRRQKVALNEMVATVQESLKPEINGRAVIWDIAALPEVECDVPMLRQVFANLLGNAVKYSRKQAEARISVSARSESDVMVEITVRDNGAGFDMKYAPKLFGVFQRLHSESEFEGTGVGLAIVRRIVQRHGGRIWAESAPGAGAAFYFTLPVARARDAVS